MNAASDLLGFTSGFRPANSPLIMAGPCSVESADQMDKVGRFLTGLGVTYVRGGAFKPRTSPKSFQGLGVEGLRIFREMADRYDMKVVSEVMDVRTVELAAQYVDVVQVGARNMQNYDLLRECGKLRIPILLKRGLASTMSEWYSAVEYIHHGGNEQCWLCERGHRTYMGHVRFMLDIAGIADAVKKGFIVIADPSHPAGRRDLVRPLSLASLAAGAHGLLIETHPNPSEALSDAAQQLDFEEFTQLYKELMTWQLT